MQAGGFVSGEQLVVQVDGGVQSVVHDVEGVQFVVQVELVGVVPPLPLVFPPPLLDACSAGPCSRKGTRKAPIPATIRAIAPTLRLVDESILFPISLFLELKARLRGLGI